MKYKSNNNKKKIDKYKSKIFLLLNKNNYNKINKYNYKKLNSKNIIICLIILMNKVYKIEEDKKINKIKQKLKKINVFLIILNY